MTNPNVNYVQPGASGAANASTVGGLDDDVTGRAAGGGINTSPPLVTDLHATAHSSTAKCGAKIHNTPISCGYSPSHQCYCK